jgi:hypothetical protein
MQTVVSVKKPTGSGMLFFPADGLHCNPQAAARLCNAIGFSAKVLLTNSGTSRDLSATTLCGNRLYGMGLDVPKFLEKSVSTDLA